MVYWQHLCDIWFIVLERNKEIDGWYLEVLTEREGELGLFCSKNWSSDYEFRSVKYNKRNFMVVAQNSQTKFEEKVMPEIAPALSVFVQFQWSSLKVLFKTSLYIPSIMWHTECHYTWIWIGYNYRNDTKDFIKTKNGQEQRHIIPSMLNNYDIPNNVPGKSYICRVK